MLQFFDCMIVCELFHDKYLCSYTLDIHRQPGRRHSSNKAYFVYCKYRLSISVCSRIIIVLLNRSEHRYSDSIRSKSTHHVYCHLCTRNQSHLWQIFIMLCKLDYSIDTFDSSIIHNIHLKLWQAFVYIRTIKHLLFRYDSFYKTNCFIPFWLFICFMFVTHRIYIIW